MMWCTRSICFRGWKTLHDESGSAAVEFALIAPVFLVLLAGTFEIGMMIQGKFDLISDVSAAAHHSLAIGGTLDAGAAQTVATTLAGLLAGNERTATVTLNNAATATLVSGNVSSAQTGAEVAACYCPSRSDDQVTWGASVACDASCGDGSHAGRYVLITIQAPWTPLVFVNGLFSDKTLQSTAMVRLP